MNKIQNMMKKLLYLYSSKIGLGSKDSKGDKSTRRGSECYLLKTQIKLVLTNGNKRSFFKLMCTNKTQIHN